MTRSLRSCLLATVAAMTVLSLTACDDDESPEPIPLSETEAELFGRNVFRQGFTVGLRIPLQQSAAAGVSMPISDSFDATDLCDGGGSIFTEVSYAGVEDDETGAADVEVTLVQSHQACVIQEGQSDSYTFVGAPAVTHTYDITDDGAGDVSLIGTIDGAFAWSSGDRSGQCVIDVTITGQTVGEESISVTLEGSSCGHPISETVIAS